ncbi:hypothetical protein Dimus_017772 [Dionaea muscipula]
MTTIDENLFDLLTLKSTSCRDRGDLASLSPISSTSFFLISQQKMNHNVFALSNGSAAEESEAGDDDRAAEENPNLKEVFPFTFTFSSLSLFSPFLSLMNSMY